MTSRLAVVTDSAACLPPGLAAELGIATVPLHVKVGEREYLEGEGIHPVDLAAALRKGLRVTTSRPSPAEVLATYERLAGEGVTQIVSVHLSAAMSGTRDSACLAAEQSPVQVQVVDSTSLGMGLGYAVLSAARAAADGADLDSVVAAVRDRAGSATVLFYVDTLDHLWRGGRIGHAQALLGSALAVKPLLRLVAGQIALFEKVRTSSRAVARLEEVAVQCALGADVDITVHHLDSSQRAQQLAERLAERTPTLVDLHVVEVGAAIGAHVGPGLLGIVVSPR